MIAGEMERGAEGLRGTRLCVKGLPKHASEERLRKMFGEHGVVTDVKIVRTPDGKSRLFGFVGMATREEAERARRETEGTYMDTSRLRVEEAKGVGEKGGERPWSKYSEGSSRYEGKEREEGEGERERDRKRGKREQVNEEVIVRTK